MPRRSSAARVPPTRSRVALLAVLLALAFAAVTHSSSDGHERDRIAEAVRRGADRLVSLQSPDGAWPRGLTGSADLAQAGRSGRALLAAHEITRDPRHLRSALLAAQALLRGMKHGEAVSTGNLLFLTEMGRVRQHPELIDAAAGAWTAAHPVASPEAGVLAARQLMASPNRTSWLDGAWRNYLLVRAADESQLARELGHDAWADAFLLEAAGSWAPKHDHEFWASAAGSLLAALSESGDPRAQRLELAQRGLIEANQLVDGVAWNDTPYDTYVYASETAAAVEGLARNDRGARIGSAAFDGMRFLAERQSSRGGWGSVLALDDAAPTEDGSHAEDAVAETPDLDAQVVRTLAIGLRG